MATKSQIDKFNTWSQMIDQSYSIDNKKTERNKRLKINKSQDTRNKNFPDTITYQFNNFPINDYKDGLWITMTPKKIDHQSTNTRVSNSVETSEVREVFEFLAPISISSTIDHTWEHYDSIASQLASVYANYNRYGTDIATVGSNVYSAATNVMKNLLSGKSTDISLDSIKNSLNKLSSSNVVNQRIDAPLVYKNSQNLVYNFSFELSYYSDAETEISYKINKLIKYSCPEITGGITEISPPYVFKVVGKSKLSGSSPLLYIKNAALINIQPTYNQPFVNGHPTKVTLNLTFIDIEPLSRKSFDELKGDIVTVSSTSSK